MSGTVPIEWYDREAEKVKFWMVKAQDTERQLAEKDAAGRAVVKLLVETQWQGECSYDYDESHEACEDCGGHELDDLTRMFRREQEHYRGALGHKADCSRAKALATCPPEWKEYP